MNDARAVSASRLTGRTQATWRPETATSEREKRPIREGVDVISGRVCFRYGTHLPTTTAARTANARPVAK
jgi:hypothetical protein